MSAVGEQKNASENGVWEVVKIVVQAIIIAVVVRTLAFQPFNIPSGSMIPTLLVGDYIFVSKWSYGFSRYSIPFSPNLFQGRVFGSAPHRGDVAVFKFPPNPAEDYIKRVVGLPGDRIQMVHGILTINGTAVRRVADGTYKATDEFGRTYEAPLYKETLPDDTGGANGVTHEILELHGDTDYRDETDVYTVPPDHYFMMGDDRDNSSDSRVPPEQGGVGYVPFENFVGKAQTIFFSVEDGHSALEIWRWPWIVRPERLFHGVR